MKRMYFVFLVAFAFFGAFAGYNLAAQDLDAEAKQFTPAEGTANVYIARKSELFGSKVAFKLLVDGQLVSKLHTGTYQMIALSPGKHKIEIKVGLGKVAQPLDIKAGKNYFFSTGSKSGNTVITPELTIVLFEKMGKLMISQSTRAVLLAGNQEEPTDQTDQSDQTEPAE